MHRNTARDPYGVCANTASGTPMGYVPGLRDPLRGMCQDDGAMRQVPTLYGALQGWFKAACFAHTPANILLPSVRIEPSQSKSADHPRSGALSGLAPPKNQRDILSRLLPLGHIGQKPKGFRGISRFIARYAPIRPYKPDNILISF